MIDLTEVHPSLCEKFSERKFTVRKTNRKFSKVTLDQNHKQLNSGIKGVGRAFGLTENDAALQRWLLTGPEVARLLEELKFSIHLTKRVS